MSHFINASCSESQTHLLKTKFLKPVLLEYNKILSENSQNTFIETQSESWLIPCNQNKYFMFVIDKKLLEPSCNNSTQIIYFFPLNLSTPNNTSDSDFFMETGSRITESGILFEGHIYKEEITKKMWFYVNDMFAKNTNFPERKVILENLFKNELDINCGIIIRVAPSYPRDDRTESMYLSIAMKNFQFGNQINSVEYIKYHGYYHTQSNTTKTAGTAGTTNTCNTGTGIFTLEKTKYTQVYLVHGTGNSANLLYIPNNDDVLKLEKMFEKVLFLQNVPCVFNMKFQKWQLQ